MGQRRRGVRGSLSAARPPQPSSKRRSRDEWRALFVAENGHEPADQSALLQWVDKKVKAEYVPGKLNPEAVKEIYSLLSDAVRQVDPLMPGVTVSLGGRAHRHGARRPRVLRLTAAEMAVIGDPARKADPAREAIVAIKERLILFPQIKEALLEKRAARTGRTVGRRSPEENYWLAREIADILSNVPGVEVKASKAAPTLFSRVLKLCAECVGHLGSVERIATAAAKQVRPVMVDEETWQTYRDSASKKARDNTASKKQGVRTVRLLTKPRRR